MTSDEKSREANLRRVAANLKLKLSKGGKRSKTSAPSGGYELRNSGGTPVFRHDEQNGGGHLATLDEIEGFLEDYVKNRLLAETKAETGKSNN
jgi:hypothetical protein